MRTHAHALAFCAAVMCTTLVGTPRVALAWEPDTTHAGLAEQAALHSRLHQRLREQMGLESGLFAALTVPPADAPALLEVLRAFNPTHGHVPDSRGRMLALGWLAAGAASADVPAAHAAHHFFDAWTGRGLSDGTIRGLPESLQHRLYPRLARATLPREGNAAPDWVVDPANPMGLAGFLDQYALAVTSRSPDARARHLAGALLAAGAILHVLQDMGSPAHARDDLAAYLEDLGSGPFDVGSRFERIAALSHGRLGVPAPGRQVVASSLRAFFTAPDLSGLADRTARLWFSSHTLPRSVRIRPGIGQSQLGTLLQESLVHPHPAPLPRLDLETARKRTARLVDDQGVCLANYQLRDDGTLFWFMDDACMVEQVAAILPEVAAYSTGLLDWMFRGAITLRTDDQGGSQGLVALAGGTAFGAGTLTFFWEDDSGVRVQHGEPVPVSGAAVDAALARAPAPPAQARAVAVLFQGQDAGGEPLVAAGYRQIR